MAIDVLEHDDRIIHHQPDRQHHRQQREGVDREAGCQHQRKGGDQTDRDGDEGNEGCTQRMQENDDHDGDQRDCLENGAVDRLDRAVDEHGVVVGDLDRHAGRQVVLDVRQLGTHRIGQHQRVGGGLLDDAD